MQVHRGFKNLPEFKNAVLTIGSFDGVHHGHRTIIRRLIDKAREVHGDSIILTFDPHPRQVVFPNDDSFRLLNTLEEKINLLEKTDLDHLIIAPFTIEFSQINPYRYVEDILINRIKVKHLIIGYDHRFGLNREGNIDILNIYAKKGAFTVEEISKQDVDDLHVSSSKIRNHLLEGKIKKAKKLLGDSYQLTGEITQGSQIAGALGYPTANCTIKNKSKLIPAPGTYAARAICEGKVYTGMLYIGKSPTLSERRKDFVEMNLFASIDQPLYGNEISILPEKRFRGDMRFQTKAELTYNIACDKIEVEHYFKHRSAESKCITAILNYNGLPHLKSFLNSHNVSTGKSVVVIDNASTDESVTYLADNFPLVQVVQLSQNRGFAKGYNEGLKNIGSKYVAIVNSDIRVTGGWSEPLIDYLEKNTDVAGVQPKILSEHHPELFEYAGASGGLMDAIGYPFCRGRILNTLEEDTGQYNDILDVFWVSGAAMVIRTDLFKKAGGFDSDFFAHMEEIDLCWRLKKAGYKFSCIPTSIVYHVGGGTLNYESPRKVFLNLRNNYWMILKNFSVRKLFYALPLRILIDMAYILLFLFKGKLGHFFSGIKGLLSGLFGVNQIGKKRREIKFFISRYGRGPMTESGRLKIILPFSYFFGRKQKFSDYK